MKLLQEVARRGYNVWGILDHKGKVTPGETNPNASTHADLWKNTPAKNRHSVVEYAHSSDGSDMMVRTCSRAGLITALQHWNRLPQGPETVTHDHCDNAEGITHYGDKVAPHKALLTMNRLLNEYDR